MATADRLAACLAEGDDNGAIELIGSDPSLANATLTDPQHRDALPAIHAAVVCDRPPVVAVLIDAGADIETAWGPEGWRPLHIAVLANRIAVARVLLDYGAMVDASDARDKAPLMWCVLKRHFECGELLLEYGATIDQRWKGLSLLHHEAKDGKTPTVAFMLEHGADPNQTDGRGGEGSTPLHGCARADRLNAAKVLVEHGASVNAKTDAGESVLDAALASKKQKLVPLLLEHGAKKGDA